jgi:hypothetical protein
MCVQPCQVAKTCRVDIDICELGYRRGLSPVRQRGRR